MPRFPLSILPPILQTQGAMSSISSQLDPISDAHPCGEDLSFSPLLDEIIDARRSDDPTLDQGEWVTALKESNWPFVSQRCSFLLTTKSKDLRLGVWFAEASARMNKFRGLGDGYALIAGLCSQFWDGLYPLPEDGEYEARVGNLVWLLTQSVKLIRTMPITEGKDTAYSTADFEAARARAASGEKTGAKSDGRDGLPTLASLDAARRKGSRSFYETLLEDSNYCRDALLTLESTIDPFLGSDGPGFSVAKAALDEVIHSIEGFAADAGVKRAQAINAASVDAAGELSAFEGVSPGFSVSAGPIGSRAQALEQLRDVAEFFRRTEPHSPVAYLADKAANWGDLPLHAWLRTVIKDGASLAQLEELLGVPPLTNETPD
jgi:type VI secretion system protein ImpA